MRLTGLFKPPMNKYINEESYVPFEVERTRCCGQWCCGAILFISIVWDVLFHQNVNSKLKVGTYTTPKYLGGSGFLRFISIIIPFLHRTHPLLIVHVQ